MGVCVHEGRPSFDAVAAGLRGKGLGWLWCVAVAGIADSGSVLQSVVAAVGL